MLKRTLVQRTENVFKFSQYITIGISCPHRGCSCLISEEMLRKIITSEALLSAFEYVLLDQTVHQELARELTRCPLGIKSIHLCSHLSYLFDLIFIACGNFLQEDCFCVNPDCRQELQRRRDIEERKKLRRELFLGIGLFIFILFNFPNFFRNTLPWMVSKSWFKILPNLPFPNRKERWVRSYVSALSLSFFICRFY